MQKANLTKPQQVRTLWISLSLSIAISKHSMDTLNIYIYIVIYIEYIYSYKKNNHWIAIPMLNYQRVYICVLWLWLTLADPTGEKKCCHFFGTCPVLFWKDSWWSISHLSGDITFPGVKSVKSHLCAMDPHWIPVSTGGIAISCSWMTQRLSGHSKAASISSSTAASGNSLGVADSLHVFNCCFSCIGYKRL